GLHIHVPIAPLYSWDQIKSFAKTIGREMVTRHPDLYTIKMSKPARQKRIFIDYFRNGRGATSVMPYSLRARSVSAVAMPVSWEELPRLKEPDIFTLQKTYDYLHRRKKDPWRDFFKREQRISILHPMFDKDRE